MDLIANALTKIAAAHHGRDKWGDPDDGVFLLKGEADALVLKLTAGTEKDLTFAAYGARALTTAFYPGGSMLDAVCYLSLKLAGEAGEVAQKIAKAIRDNASIIDETRRLALLDELGDCVWYVNAIASELNSSLTEVAQRNLVKIEDRQARGALGGDGDNR
jgi:NTP pyrophosphatase (non-canonical NTP hydrolase)